MRHRSSPYFVAIGSLALVAFATRAASLDVQSLWRDEVDALRFATVPWTEMLANFTRPGWNGPLYFLLLRGWIALAGTSEYAMRFFSLAFGVLCVPLVYALGRRLFDPQAGLLAALLVCASPYLAWYGQEVKMYTLVVALALVAIYGLHRAIEGGGSRWWVVQVVATSLAFYSHILAALLVPVQVVIYFAGWPRARRRWVGALVSLACLTLPYLPLGAWQAVLLFQARDTGFFAYTLGQMVEILLKGWSTGILGWGWPRGAVLVGALAAWGLVSPAGSIPARDSSPAPDQETLSRPGVALAPVQLPTSARGTDVWGRLTLLGWLVVPLLAVWLVSLRQPLFTDRYLIWTAPAFYLLIARGLASLCRLVPWHGLGRVVVVLLVGVILALDGGNLWRQATVPVKSDFRAAASYVFDYPASGGPVAPRAAGQGLTFECYLPLVVRSFDALIVFQIPYSRHTFDYYFPIEEYPWAEGLYTNYRAPDGSYLMGEQETAWRMEEMTVAYDVVWLVVTEMEMWDQRGLVKGWLEANARRADEAHFTRVDVYRYVR